MRAVRKSSRFSCETRMCLAKIRREDNAVLVMRRSNARETCTGVKRLTSQHD